MKPKKIDFAIISPETLLHTFSKQGDCYMAIAPIALQSNFYANFNHFEHKLCETIPIFQKVKFL